jgi:hypothetical protein
MSDPSGKTARPAARAKPSTAADKLQADQLWTLFQIAFQRLVERHLHLSAHLYAEAGDREWESAQAIADSSMTLALAAAAKWEAHERRNPTPRRNESQKRSSPARD